MLAAMYKFTAALIISAGFGTAAASADLPVEIASVIVSLDVTDNTAGNILSKGLAYIRLKVGSEKSIAIEFDSGISDGIDDTPVTIHGNKVKVSDIIMSIEEKCKLKHDYDEKRKTLVFYKK